MLIVLIFICAIKVNHYLRFFFYFPALPNFTHSTPPVPSGSTLEYPSKLGSELTFLLGGPVFDPLETQAVGSKNQTKTESSSFKQNVSPLLTVRDVS